MSPISLSLSLSLSLLESVLEVLKTDPRLVSQDGDLLKNKAQELAYQLDPTIIGLLLKNDLTKSRFFKEIDGCLIFDQNAFVSFVMNKEFLPDSYTSYKNKIGLNIDGKTLDERKEVSLVWAYKDCVLAGGQDKEDSKRDEIFYNETLGSDQIDRLLDPKVFTGFKRIDKDGKHDLESFRKDENGNITDNLIIKGNNLLALHSLKKRFKGKVKLIYIDPPYNTGTDSFKYNDRFNHSTWLTFMKNRLEVAKELLREDGVIFVSCDDNEQAYLKVLMDEIFDRDNCETIIWRKIDPKFDKNTNAKVVKTTKRIHEYIHVGFKNKSVTEFGKIKKLPQWKNKYNNIDDDPRGDYKQGIISFEEGHKKEEKDSEYYYSITLPSGRTMTRHFFVLKEEFEELLKDNRIYFPKNGDGVPAVKIFENEKKDFFFETILEGVGSLNSAKKEFSELFNISEDELPFDTLKPSLLLKEIIRAVTKENDIIIDYHAGSGTTAHAILELNKEDGGNRKFILAEQMDYINTVTVPRIEKVMERNGYGDFVYMEITCNAEKYIEMIRDTQSTDMLLEIWTELKTKSFVNYKLDPKCIDNTIDVFKTLSFSLQKKILIDLIDKNALYKNFSEMDDTTSEVSESDKKLNRDFYNQ